MTDTSLTGSLMLDTSPPKWWTKLLFVAVLASGLAYCASQLAGEVSNAQEATPWFLLLLALLIAFRVVRDKARQVGLTLLRVLI